MVNITQEIPMFDRRFLQSRLGQAAMASVAAMALFVLKPMRIRMIA